MVALGLALMIYNVYSILRFIRTEDDIMSVQGEARLSYVVLAFVVCFAVVYAIIFFQNLAELSIGIILLSGSMFVTFSLEWIYLLVNSLKTNTINMAEALSTVIDARDRDLRGHSRHVELLSLLIYNALPESEREGVHRSNLRYAAIFHDIGKLGVPESILNKPGRLSEHDWVVIRKHPRIGVDILKPVSSFDEVQDWIMYHHERIDGKGYYGIPGDQIPLGARILSVADTFSAIFMKRPYKQSNSYDEAVSILREVAGTQLDAHLVDIFCGIDRDKVLACSYVLGHTAGDEE